MKVIMGCDHGRAAERAASSGHRWAISFTRAIRNKKTAQVREAANRKQLKQIRRWLNGPTDRVVPGGISCGLRHRRSRVN